ncbi:MAG: CsgG/HfaB family protein [Limnochordia bacterium]|jgi:curli production assembly/transport component CsgG
MELVLIGCLMLGLLAGGMPGAEPVQDVPINIEEQMQEVLEAPESIMLSEANVTTATQLLAALPETERKIPIAVYHVADNTGQFKGDRMGVSSTVVTQGATEMLITALHRSRQFVVLDRARFGDFMNEQNLVTSSRVVEGQGPVIGAMTGADYVITGAITEYQVDMYSGGLGLRIAGKGGSQEYARASCAIDLRVTDTTTGEVVWADSLKGEILGERVGLEVFSFLGKNIVEFETGQGKQQVINLVVRTLLEEAVFKLIQSGVLTS